MTSWKADMSKFFSCRQISTCVLSVRVLHIQIIFLLLRSNLHVTLSIFFFYVILFLPLPHVIAGELSRYFLIDMAKGMVSIDSEGSKVSFLIGTTTTSPQNEHNFNPNPSHFFKSSLKQGYIPKCLITSVHVHVFQEYFNL